MKKRILALCAVVSMSSMLFACGNPASGSADSASSTEAQSEAATEAQAEVTTEEQVAASEEENQAVEETSTDDSAVEETTVNEDNAIEADDESGDTDEEIVVDYSVFTDASKEEVEAYAQKIVDATIAKDWDTIGDMIEYPIGSEEFDNLCNNKEEFVAYANEVGFDDALLAKIESWTVSDLWANYMGASIGDGDIWFRDININNPEFKIVSYLGLYEGE
ncbi:hypothetical protein [Butyrivibrio sp. VCD2006]|uniref:hypothetical protein n=1 Tax=Butyrivibrio sp. VCD2006 TaxID=1280664 RepID=UPI000424A485|nr:hypothetical protein [Butyrivibrio sp. VCD2006]